MPSELLIVGAVGIFVACIASSAAYRNGVRDAFYELNEPGHPGAARVRKQMAEEGLKLRPLEVSHADS